jgi:hypothetical protein
MADTCVNMASMRFSAEDYQENEIVHPPGLVAVVGVRPYGKVHRVPGLFYVATNFFHIWFIPLFPTGSWLILDDGSQRSASIGLSARSILFAYLRPILFVPSAGSFLIVLAGVMSACFDQGPPPLRVIMVALLLFLGFSIPLYLTYSLAYDGPTEALALARRVRFDPNIVLQHFGNLEELDPRIEGD